MKIGIRDAWKSRSLIFLLASNDLKLRYKSSILGAMWSFLEPLLILAILFIVFSSILKSSVQNYPIFLLTGIITFQMFSRATSMGSESILAKGGILSSVRIPTVAFPISSTLTALYMMGFEFMILSVFMIVYHFMPPITILFLPILLVLLFVLGLALAIPFSVLNVHYRDLRSIWAIILQAAFFLTPVVYKLDFLPKDIQMVLQYSPLVQLVNMIRGVTLEGNMPDMNWFLYTVAIILSILTVGMLIFKRYKANLVEKF